jgi:hypothetical protein
MPAGQSRLRRSANLSGPCRGAAQIEHSCIRSDIMASLFTRPVLPRPSQPTFAPPVPPLAPPAPRRMTDATVPAGNLAEFLCSRLPAPPQSDFAHCEVAEEVELKSGGQWLRGTTTFVGLRKLEVHSRASIECDERVTVKLCNGLHPGSTAVVSRCIEIDGGWKVDLLFAPDPPVSH